MKFTVKLDLFRMGTTHMPDYQSRAVFGEYNSGVVVDADDEGDARRKVGAKHGVNPFYLKAIAVKGGK